MKCCLTSQPEMSMIQHVSVRVILVGTEQQTIQNSLTNIMKVIIQTDGDHLLLKSERYCKWWEGTKNNIWGSTKDNLGIVNSIEGIIDLNRKTWKMNISVNTTKMQIKDRDIEGIDNKEETKEINITNALIDQKTLFLLE